MPFVQSSYCLLPAASSAASFAAQKTKQLANCTFRFESHTHSIWPSWAWHCCPLVNREYYAYCFLLLGFLGLWYSETKKRKKRASTPPTYR